MADADIIGALVTLLKADVAVAALVGDDVYGGELPQEAVKRMPRQMLLVQASGGASMMSGSDVNADTQRIDIFGTGSTPREADLVRRTAATALRKIRRRIVSGVLIHWINPGGGFFAAREVDGLWPQSFQSFQILHALQEV